MICICDNYFAPSSFTASFLSLLVLLHLNVQGGNLAVQRRKNGALTSKQTQLFHEALWIIAIKEKEGKKWTRNSQTYVYYLSFLYGCVISWIRNRLYKQLLLCKIDQINTMQSLEPKKKTFWFGFCLKRITHCSLPGLLRQQQRGLKFFSVA